MSFGLYIHVPFCASRCGYCDFNTYTPGELGSSSSPESYLEALERELELVAARPDTHPATTVFIGGGTPSMLGAHGLSRILRAAKNTIGIAPGAEVTTESNPESTSPEFFEALLNAGYTRISLGMQSTASHVLRILERRHTPGRALQAAHWAHNAGFQHLNLDMIYGTPGESDDDLARTLDDVLSTPVDHVSAYSLIVEDGTAMARKVRRGELPAPDEDILAHRYTMIDNALSSANFEWYEVSNWARPQGECLHNLGYWHDHDWWGAGPGAHSHIGDTRFWNHKHPATYSRILAENTLPIKDSETLTPADRHTEKLMLGLRLKEGIPEHWISPAATPVLEELASRDRVVREDGRVRVTNSGRLLADGIISAILLAEETA